VGYPAATYLTATIQPFGKKSCCMVEVSLCFPSENRNLLDQEEKMSISKDPIHYLTLRNYHNKVVA